MTKSKMVDLSKFGLDSVGRACFDSETGKVDSVEITFRGVKPFDVVLEYNDAPILFDELSREIGEEVIGELRP